jgi:hypothetical protein
MKFKKHVIYYLSVFYIVTNISCRNAEKNAQTESQTPETSVTAGIKVPVFSGDTAYAFVEKQVSFGPRVAGSKASKNCGDWLVKTFKEYGLEVTEQPFTAILYNGKTVASRNIIASYNSKATKRIILASHWDSRPFSDQDPLEKTKAIDGANDGASGVGVLLEIARKISKDSLNLGVDFILFDTEDWGAPENYNGQVAGAYGGYCLGSEYWSKNLHKPGYSAYYGILLDMVGAPDATFRKEGFSMQNAPSIVQNVWNTAAQLGYSNLFIGVEGQPITDDHLPVMQNAKIPMIDIIDTKQSDRTFFQHWHTLQDNMSTIDRNTLKAVGQTLMQVIYNEANTI